MTSMFNLDEIPHAAGDLANRRVVLDTRNREAALADDPGRIGFYIREVTVYEYAYTPEELDEAAPGWRQALANPADHAAPGRYDLECFLLDDLDSGNEIDAYGRMSIHLGITDRTPTHMRVRRTLTDGTVTEETITVEADDLDDVTIQWRAHIGDDLTAQPGSRWWLDPAARFAEAQREDVPGETPAKTVEVLTITQ
jgi:hypothetical protein